MSADSEKSPNFHVEYMDVTQHWNAQSEKYAGADGLLTMIYNGWNMKPEVLREERWFAGMRLVYIYHITLERDGEVVKMPVIHNPYISRMIARHDINVVPMSKDKVN